MERIASNWQAQEAVLGALVSRENDDQALETLVLEERDGTTTLTATTLHDTRAAHLADGRMEAGRTDAYARLDPLLAALRAT